MNVKILETLKKLLRLSANNSNEHEAQAAMLKAQQIAIQNNINIASVAHHASKPDTDSGLRYVKNEKMIGQRFSICHKFSCGILLKHFNVKIVSSGGRYSGRVLYFIGTENNVDFAKFAYDYLNETFLNCWREYKKTYQKPLNYRETYIFGLFRGLMDKLEQNKREQENNISSEFKNSYALVVADANKGLEMATNNFFPTRKSVKSRQVSAKDGKAFSDGYERGKAINVNRPIC